jgi:uncharacterized membrane protein YfcA
MTILHAVNWLYVISGFGVGFLVGLTGVGGGALMTPLLIVLFGVHPVTAVGTDLLYACATKTGGSLVHSLHRTIDWRVVGRLALGSVPAAAITLGVLHVLDINSAIAKDLVTKVLGPALILTALALVLRRPLVRFYAKRVSGFSPEHTRNLTIATGVVLGALVTISSVGAGALGVTALILLYPTLPVSRVVGSDIAHAVPLTLVSGAGHWLLGSVDVAMLGSLLLGSLPGIMIASNLAPRAPEPVLRFLLAAVLVLVAVRMFA